MAEEIKINNDTNYIMHRLTMDDKVVEILERIARAQEGVLAIAAEARIERSKLAKEMNERLKAGFTQEKK